MRHILVPTFVLFALATGCADDDPVTSSSSSSGSSSGPPAADRGEAAAAGCPSQETLIQGTTWVSCVAGKSLAGTEPFTKKACELRFDADGGLTYSLAGAAPLTAPKASWGNGATGTYQNSASGASRVFIASVSPELPRVPGQPRLLDVTLSIFGIAQSEDTVAVRYLDATDTRQTYNCTI